jgi:hypothetical protein
MNADEPYQADAFICGQQVIDVVCKIFSVRGIMHAMKGNFAEQSRKHDLSKSSSRKGEAVYRRPCCKTDERGRSRADVPKTATGSFYNIAELCDQCEKFIGEIVQS